ncbi:MAG: hypothetical protein QOD14_2569 [Solirubrobacterales bacterium]|nr:hypothetical protein [Solirubrobacterales bacterium]
MSALGVIRPHDWDLPLIVHILGAMILVGALMLSAVSLVAAWRTNSAAMTRLGFMSLFYGAIPGWIVMRGGAAWIANKEGLDGSNIDIAWLNIGNATADGGFLLLIIATVIGWLMVRGIKRDGSASPVPTRIATGLVSLMLVAYLVAVWAMTTKPG